MTDLKLKYKSQSCNCGTLCDYLIRDQIVIDIKDDCMRQQLLHKTNLTLLKAVEIGQVHEMANSQLKSIQRGKASHEESAIIDSVKFKRNQNRDNSQRPQYNRYHNDNQAQARGGNQSQPRNRCCGKCGTSHKWGQCPAYGSIIMLNSVLAVLFMSFALMRKITIQT